MHVFVWKKLIWLNIQYTVFQDAFDLEEVNKSDKLYNTNDLPSVSIAINTINIIILLNLVSKSMNQKVQIYKANWNGWFEMNEQNSLQWFAKTSVAYWNGAMTIHKYFSQMSLYKMQLKDFFHFHHICNMRNSPITGRRQRINCYQ